MRRHERAAALTYFVLVSLWVHVQGYGVMALVSHRAASRRAHATPEPAASASSAEPLELAFEPVDEAAPEAPPPSAADAAVASADAAPLASDAAPVPPRTIAERPRPRPARVERPVRVEPERAAQPAAPQVAQLELLPSPSAPPPPPPPPQASQQTVDQPVASNEPRPDNPAFLSQSNHNVDEQTVAALRSLSGQGVASEAAPEPSARASAEPGNASSDRTGDDRDQRGDPTVTPSQAPRVQASAGPSEPSTRAPGGVSASAAGGGAPGLAGPSGAPGAPGNLAGVTLPTERLQPWLLGPEPGGDARRSGSGGAEGPTAAPSGAPGPTGAGGAQGANGAGGAGRAGAGLAAAQRVGVAGLGAAGTQRALTPTHSQYAQVFGADAQREQREAQLRRAQRRGGYSESWRENRQAIENFTPTIRVGNQTALRTAAAPFAVYLSSMHRRIHRHFADGFIAGLEGAPPGSPLNDPSLVTTLEIALERDGRIARLGVVRTSGNAAFDVAALNSVRRGAPYGAAPEAIVSGDGRVYLRWGFYRSERQCGTFNAEPYLLPNPGAAPPPLRAPSRAPASDHSKRALPPPSSSAAQARRERARGSA